MKKIGGKTITGAYKCGHVWTREFVKTPSRREMATIIKDRERSVCPNCEYLAIRNADDAAM